MKPKVEDQYYQDLLSWSELEHLLNIRPLLNQERVQLLKDPEEDKFQWNDDPWSIDNNCIPPYMLKIALDGSTCYFRDMSRMTKKLNALANELEKEYSMSADAHVYMCLDKDKEHPFGIHFDLSDNVIIQCEGVTNFKVWDKVEGTEKIKSMKDYERMNPYRMDIKKEPIIDEILRPGDAIWIPRFHPHLATTLEDPRLSVSFPLQMGGALQNREWISLP